MLRVWAMVAFGGIAIQLVGLMLIVRGIVVRDVSRLGSAVLAVGLVVIVTGVVMMLKHRPPS